MRVMDFEIYRAKELFAFAEFVKAIAETKQVQEESEAKRANQSGYAAGALMGSVGSAYTNAYTPEYYAKINAEAQAQAKAAKTAD